MANVNDGRGDRLVQGSQQRQSFLYTRYCIVDEFLWGGTEQIDLITRVNNRMTLSEDLAEPSSIVNWVKSTVTVKKHDWTNRIGAVDWHEDITTLR